MAWIAAAGLAATAFAACAAPLADVAEETEAKDLRALYESRIVGRWGETPACDGLVWDFRANSVYAPNGFDAPEGVHCPRVELLDSAAADLRFLASNCDRGRMLHGDLVLDMTLSPEGPAETLTIAGVFAPVLVRPWRRCAPAETGDGQ
mgnify:CR=1 FL=1